MTIDRVLRIPTVFSELMALSDKKPKILIFGGGSKITDLKKSMPPDGTVLLWDEGQVDTGGHHAAVVKGGKICGYNQGGIARGAGSGYSELDVVQLVEVAKSCYTISESKIVSEARQRIVKFG